MSVYQLDYSRQIAVYPGNHYVLLMPYSEACMHMRISDTVQSVKVQETGVRLNDGNGPYLTFGEAGIYQRTMTCPHTGRPTVVRYTYGMKIPD